MPSPEGERPRQKGRIPPERSPKPEQERQPYLQVAYFDNEHIAGHAYDQAQEAIYTHEQNDLSSYRFILDDNWHVAVLGEAPPESLDRSLQDILGQGTPTQLPEEIVAYLQERRQEATKLGPWVEGHYRPGKVVKTRRKRD